jgi:tetratricopeptide (TPR) repeat protein
MAHEMLNRPEKAAEEYRKAIEADPGNYRAMENLAAIFERDGAKISEAIELYKKALALDPRQEWKDHCAACIVMLESRLRPEDASAVGCWNLGNRKALAGDDRGAEAMYTRAINLDPGLFQAYFSRGLLRLKSERLQDALADFDETARIAPRLRGAFIQHGLVHEKLGNIAQAGQSFERAAANDPHDPEAWFHLGRMREYSKEYLSAMECYQEALGQRPKPELGKLIRDRVSAVWTLGNFDAKKNSPTLKRLRELW